MVENGRNNLDCCVVRDLLPAYLEGLTEEETSAQVRAHLEDCENCRELEKDMRAQVPLEKAPKGTLKFLKRVKRTRLLAAVLSVVVALWCMWWLYDQEFHYPNTEAGRLAAVEDYIPSPPGSSIDHVKEGDPIRVVAWQEVRGNLFLFYQTEGEEKVQGVVNLDRGWNGKYRIRDASMAPSRYTAGVTVSNPRVRGEEEWHPIFIAGRNCREIYAAVVEYWWPEDGGSRRGKGELIYPIDQIDFLWVLENEDVQQALGVDVPVEAHGVRFLDRDGEDITEQFYDQDSSASWGGGKSTAEQFLLYVYMGIIALLGLTMVRYFLRKD
ncbi:MAG: zf-HC2 domain-containing protein [Clostridiales bacterium]|nr:zf-HC2 domain-containing protein [Clostridiales bacterium]